MVVVVVVMVVVMVIYVVADRCRRSLSELSEQRSSSNRPSYDFTEQHYLLMKVNVIK
jgi:hypothetical protein